LHYQPKYNLASLRINGVEALVRWQSKDFGLVSPATFIPLAEETGLIDDIGLFVLKQACTDCKDWIAQGYEMPVSVNLSAAQLSSGMLPDNVLAILAETQLAPRYLELEITESMLMQDQNAIDSQISALSDQGINFSIDDFGTGYSNLHYLSRFKAATLKIDQSFIKNLNKSSQHYNLVKGIVVLAKTLGLTTVAEGVEDQNTLHILGTMECDSVQGYLLSRPVSLCTLYTQLQVKTAG
jgi:EAL domain-containing protein (putative c-di-GMP-specific phosphodiesterase class I)